MKQGLFSLPEKPKVAAFLPLTTFHPLIILPDLLALSRTGAANQMIRGSASISEVARGVLLYLVIKQRYIITTVTMRFNSALFIANVLLLLIQRKLIFDILNFNLEANS